MLYLALTLPPGRAVTLFPGWTIGIISRDGRSFATVGSPQRPRISSLTAYGEETARDELQEAIGAWDRRGRPGPRQLQVTASYRGTEALLRRRWQTKSAPEWRATHLMAVLRSSG